MSELPEKFPEYSIMYKTILSQIRKLEKTNTQGKKEIELKIQRYRKELEKIKEMFPESYFDEIDHS